MAILDEIHAQHQIPDYLLVINGVEVHNIVRGQIHREFSEDNRVVVAAVELTWALPDEPADITRGQTVTIDLGYGAFLQRRFTGYVFARQGQVGEVTWTCLDPLLMMTRSSEFPERDVSGQTVQAAVDALVALVGITDRNIVLPAFTLGTAVDAVLSAGPSAGMVAQLLDIKDGYLWALPSGTVVGRQVTFAPAPSATYSFDSAATGPDARILDGSDHDDPDFFRDKVVATGATLEAVSEDDPPPDPLEVTEVNTGSGIQRPPPPDGVFSVEPYSNGLIDTLEELAAYAGMKLTRRARNPRYVTIDQIGNPLVDLGMTLEYDVPLLKVTGLWFVMGHTEDFGDGYRSTVALTGGDEAGGSNGIVPVAAFTWGAVQQLLGTTVVTIVTVTSTAQDLDGTIESIEYSGDQTGSGDPFTFVVDPDDFPGGVSLTQTVTDNDGNTDDVTHVIPLDPAEGNAITLPSIGLARENGADISPDGAQTWNQQTLGGADTLVVAMRPADGVNYGHEIIGREGALWVTRDACQTPPTEVLADVGSIFVSVVWDWRNTLNVFAITADGRLYVSIDAGDTFGLYGGAGLRTTLGKPDLIVAAKEAIGLPAGAFGATPVFIFATDGHGNPVIAYDYNITNSWAFTAFDGELAADLPGADDLELCTACSPSELSGTSIGFRNTSGAVKCMYWLPPEGSGWKRAVGLDGLDGPAFVAGDLPLAGPLIMRTMFPGSRSSWSAEDGFTYVETTDVLPAGFSPNHGLWEADVLTGLFGLQGIYLVAAEDAGSTGGVFKSIDGLFSLTSIYPAGGGFPTWPGGGRAKMISIGAPGAPTPATGNVYRCGLNRETSLWNGTDWATIRAAESGSPAIHRFFVYASGAMVCMTGTASSGTGGVYYTGPTDTSWTLTLPEDTGRQCHGLDMDAGGVLWALMCNNSSVSGGQTLRSLQIWKSVDEGATWTMVYEDPGYAGTNNTRALNQGQWNLTADKNSAGHVFVSCRGSGSGEPTGIWSTDGSTFNDRTTDPVPANASAAQVMFVNSGRLVAVDRVSSHIIVSWSDDDGATWTTGQDMGATETSNIVLLVHRAAYGDNGLMPIDPSSSDSHNLMATDDNWETFTEIPLDAEFIHIGTLELDFAGDVCYEGGTTAFKVVTAALGGVGDRATSDFSGPGGTIAMPR